MADIIATCFSGIVIKLYDDLTDNNSFENDYFKNNLHTLSCLLLGASSFNDFTYCLLLFSVNFAQYLSNPESFSKTHEKSILHMYPIFSIMNIISLRGLSIFEIIVLLITSVGSFTEGSLVKEETSVKKLLMRIVVVILFGSIILITTFFNILSRSLLKLFLFFIFYIVTSCGFQFYNLFIKSSKASSKAGLSRDLLQHNESSETSRSSYGFLDYCKDWCIW